MEKDFFEKEIYLKEKDKIIVKIDNKITKEKNDVIIADFKKLVEQMRNSNIDINQFEADSFDFIVIMLIIIHCTNMFEKRNFDIQKITSTYTDMFKNNIIQQISVVFLQEHLKFEVVNLMSACDHLIRLEKLSIEKQNTYKKEVENVPKKSNLLKVKDNKNMSIDDLLDQYNEQISLYNLLKDKSYKRKANAILKSIKETSLSNDSKTKKQSKKLTEIDIDEIYSRVYNEISDLDAYLDEYNDYMTLYNMFKDPSYKSKATKTLNKIKRITEEDEF